MLIVRRERGRLPRHRGLKRKSRPALALKLSSSMASQKKQDIHSQLSEVSKFYDGKSLFITGAGGFLGVVLLEALLRCCPGIHRIYILLRPKKGVQPQDRKEAIFKKEIFFKVRENPETLNKVVVVSGDVTHDNLGISSEDLNKVSEEVSIVFHCAAAISFLKPLSFMMEQNVMGTYNVIELCRKLKKLDVLVYTSTAYSNCNQKDPIEERIYKLPFTAEEAIREHKKGSEEELMSFFSMCKPTFPNFYIFTKCIAETLIAEKAADLPICIVRPSIIIMCLKGILPGYIEEGTGLTSLAIGVGKGFIRVLHCDPDIRSNQIPSDVVANTHIVGAYQKIAESLPSPYIYNCVVDEANTWKYGEFAYCLLNMVLKYPLPRSFQTPNVVLCKNKVKYWLLAIFDHYAPAIVIDSLLWLSGRKPRLVKLYRFYDRNVKVIKHFMMNEWVWKNENFKSIDDKMSAADKELFPIDMKDFTLEGVPEIVHSGAPLYLRMDKCHQKKLGSKYLPYLTALIKWSVLGCITSVFYVALF